MRNHLARPRAARVRPTSREALSRNKPALERLEQTVVDELKKHGDAGLTGKEIELRLKMRSASSRIHRLVKLGWIVRTEEKRRNPSGSMADVLVVPKTVREGASPSPAVSHDSDATAVTIPVPGKAIPVPRSIGSVYVLTSSHIGQLKICSIHKTLQGAQIQAKLLHDNEGFHDWAPKGDHHGGEDCRGCSMMISHTPISL